MRPFYRYWAVAELPAEDAQGKKLLLKKWGGSNDSMSAAKALAERAVRGVKDRIGDLRAQKDYTYGVRDIPEELIREISKDNIVTRNRMGCLVLNTSQVCFADVDIKAPGFFARWKGASREKSEQEAIGVLKTFLETKRNLSVRIYRTKAGLRYLFTHAPVAVNDEALGWLKAVGSDPIYTRLCRTQDCFRARLSPKPWRLDVGRATAYPRETPKMQEKFQKWLDDYNKQSDKFAVCRFLEAAGTGGVHSDLSALVREHDKATRADTDMPLA